jgi:glycosyltransferase involved in cell wall biosynthesis
MSLLLAAGTPHLPQVIGGVEINTHETALELNRRGFETKVLSKLSPRDWFGATRWLANTVQRKEVSVDRGLGYEVYRSRRPWSDLAGMPMPKVAVVQNGNMIEIGKAFRRRGVPSIAYLHGLEFDIGKRRWSDDRSELPFSAYIAVSTYTARRFEARFGIMPHVIPPIFRPERYRTSGERRYVTFINPVPEKGVDLALAIAALTPEIPFRFVKGWPLKTQELMRLKARIRALPNVELVERSRDMLPIYGATRVLLVPSQWDAETWGRVVSEAQFSGLPVMASDRGGLPEAVGPGGIVLPHDAPAEIWAGELRRLWSDQAHYARLSEAALVHSSRPELNLNHQIDSLLAIVRRVA